MLGALAIVCDTSLDLRKDQVVCYAVAAPRVGNSAFAAAYEALVPHTWNVINDQVRFVPTLVQHIEQVIISKLMLQSTDYCCCLARLAWRVTAMCCRNIAGITAVLLVRS